MWSHKGSQVTKFFGLKFGHFIYELIVQGLTNTYVFRIFIRLIYVLQSLDTVKNREQVMIGHIKLPSNCQKR